MRMLSKKKWIRICWSNENHDADGETKCTQGDYNHLVDYLFFLRSTSQNSENQIFLKELCN